MTGPPPCFMLPFSTVIKEPPYQVSESGYGSFNLPVEVFFRNKDEPKKVRFEYDLLLPNLNDPPINQIRSECLTFQNPSEEFRQKLLKAGGVVSGGPAPALSEKPPKPQPQPPTQKKRPATGLDSEVPKKKKPKLEGGKVKGDKKKKKTGSSSSDSSESDTSSDSDSGTEEAPMLASKKTSGGKKHSPNSWDTTSLKRLHKQLNSLQDPQQLQEIVNIIEQTGLFNLTASTFDFDLCKLDDSTLNKLEKFVEPTS